jgi:hypothetical protein
LADVKKTFFAREGQPGLLVALVWNRSERSNSRDDVGLLSRRSSGTPSGPGLGVKEVRILAMLFCFASAKPKKASSAAI